MKTTILKNALLRFLSFIILISLITACKSGTKTYPTIPLDKIETQLKDRADLIVEDIIKSFFHENGVRYLLEKDYITPMVHGRIMKNLNLYNEAYMTTPLITGNISNHKLIQVINKGVVKSMSYQLYSENTEIKFIELRIDVNIDYKLANFYLYITSKDGKFNKRNFLPEFK